MLPSPSSRGRVRAWTLLLLLLVLSAPPVRADTGHYIPGQIRLRDSLLPDQAVRLSYTTSYYASTRFNDSSGHEVASLSIPVGGINIPIFEVSQAGHLSTPLIAVAPISLFAGTIRLGAFATVPWGSRAVGVNIFDAVSQDAPTGFADPLIAPLWIGFSTPVLELSLSWGVYAPVGKYDPEDALNVGRGFTTQQIQLTGELHLLPFRVLSLLMRLTYEQHGAQEGRRVTVGDTTTLEWGIAVRPLDFDGLCFDVIVLGSHLMQVEPDTGRRFVNDFGMVQSHAAGFEASLHYLPWGLSFFTQFAWEYYTEASFQGISASAGVSIEIPFWYKTEKSDKPDD